MVVEAVVEAFLSRVVAAGVVVNAKSSAGAKDSFEQQPEMIALTSEGAAAVVVVVAVVVAAAVVGDTKIMVDQNAGAPFSLVPEFSLVEFVAVPISLEQYSSMIATAAAAADQVGHCLPGAPTLLVPYHLSLLELIENAAAVAAVYSEEQRTVALVADYVGNFELPSVGNAADLATAGYQKGLKIVDPDLDQKNQHSPYLIVQMRMQNY